MASAAFSETLQFVTDVKLRELEKRRVAYSTYASEVLAKAKKHDNDLPEKLSVLLEGIKSWSGSWSSGGNLSLKNIENWVKQAKKDPSVPSTILQTWISKLEARFNHENTRYDYAKLFGNLVTDWIKSSGTRGLTAGLSEELGTAPPDDVKNDGFEKIARQDTLEQKAHLESLIFTDQKINVEHMETYLRGLFLNLEAEKALEAMRLRLKTFSETLRRTTVTDDDMEWVIKSLLATDLLSDAKQTTLKQFAENDSCIEELASVLNMQMHSLSTWSWPADGVLVEPRRHLNGKTRFFLDSEILTSILLHYLGVKWSVELKGALQQLSRSTAWKSTPRPMTKEDWSRRSVFVKEGLIQSLNRDTIIKSLENVQKGTYYMSQLPSSVHSINMYDYEGDHTKGGSGADQKQALLHLLSTEVLFNKVLHKRCTVVRTDFEWFGPSLPFDTILTVLKFYGMPQEDLDFISAFLACPLRFKGDPPSAGARVRTRGIPISHSLSMMCGEAVMSVMDFAVNQRVDGLFLYRLHDDFWFWDASAERCAKAWAEMAEYAGLTGMKFNKEKTGSVLISEDSSHPASTLPAGDIRWGFLVMNKDGQFVIDQKQVDEHIVEFRRQLAATTSIFAWSQAYNKYMSFFIRNCGSPAMIFGRDHIDSMISTVVKIQTALFPSTNGSFVETLATQIQQKYKVNDIPMGWYLWPNAIGGLEVHDFLIELLSKRDQLPEKPEKYFIEAMDEERRLYQDAKVDWESGKVSVDKYNSHVRSTDPFFEYEEYVKARIETSDVWTRKHRELQTAPSQYMMEKTAEIEAALSIVGSGLSAFGNTGTNWNAFSAYWKWIISLYHEQMVAKYGSLAIVEPTLVPAGMVGVFKGSKMRWD